LKLNSFAPRSGSHCGCGHEVRQPLSGRDPHRAWRRDDPHSKPWRSLETITKKGPHLRNFAGEDVAITRKTGAQSRSPIAITQMEMTVRVIKQE
jgi:hypothetical protein